MRIFTRELYDRLQSNEDNLYTTHFIRKANGRGYRRIDEPAPDLKERQRLALRVLNSRHNLLLHWRACGCIPGLDVRERILEHVGWQWALTTDIKDFYPTVTLGMLTSIPQLLEYMDEEDIRCCCRTINGQLVLPQGAPTSPMLANIALTRFDEDVMLNIMEWEGEQDAMEWPRRRRAHYSRYMDDILVSINCNNKAGALALQNKVLSLVGQHGFVPNRRKTKLKPYSQKQKWIGFNLVVADSNGPSQSTLVDKRYVESVIEEGLQIVADERNPLEDASWVGKLEYIRYNDVSRFWRVKRKIALELYTRGLPVPDFFRGTGVIERFLERTEQTGRMIRVGAENGDELTWEPFVSMREQRRSRLGYGYGSGSSSVSSSSYITMSTDGTS